MDDKAMIKLIFMVKIAVRARVGTHRESWKISRLPVCKSVCIF